MIGLERWWSKCDDNRKDILETSVDRISPECYKELDQVVITASCLKVDLLEPQAHADNLTYLLKTIANARISPTPLHVVIHSEDQACAFWEHIGHSWQTNKMSPITYEFRDYTLDKSWPTLAWIYSMRALVRLKQSGHSAQWRINLYPQLTMCRINAEFQGIGRIFLSGVPSQVLEPEHLEAAGENANEVAKQQVLDLIGSYISGEEYKRKTRRRDMSESDRKKDDLIRIPSFQSVFVQSIQFVDSDFKPTMADLTED
jgi:hypothetical protein